MTLIELIERLSIMANGCGDREVVIRTAKGIGTIDEVTTRLVSNQICGTVIQVVIETE